MRPFRRLPWIAALALATLLAVPSEAAKKGEPPDVVLDALAFADTDRSKAIQLLENALEEGVGSRDLDTVRLHAGEQHRLAGDLDSARDWFAKVAERGGSTPEGANAQVGLALLDFATSADASVIATLLDTSDKDLLPSLSADRCLVLAVDAAKRSDARAVTTWSKKALVASRDDAALHARVQATLEQLGSGAEGIAALTAVRPAGDPLERAEASYASGERDEALKWAQKAVTTADASNKSRAEGLVRVLQARAEDRTNVTVLLPLTGKYEAVGKQVRDAVKFGYGTAPRTLNFVDSGATAESATAAFEKAVLTDGAIVVVGPLLTDETDAVVAASEALHTPLLSLSQSYEDTRGHQWALQAMYTRADQIDALLDFAMKERALQAFAIFSPDSPFGTHATELFKAGVIARGGRVTTEATYPAEEQNLLTYAKKLGTREGSLYELRKQAEERGGNPNTVVLPPRIDFDAIFLPESATRTPLACAALAYEEFPMGDFLPTKQSKKIPLLGLNAWNTTALIASGNEYTRNSLFPDVFSAPAVGDAHPFVQAYKTEFGRTPTALEAAAVDAGKLLAAAARSDASTRPAFREALLVATVTDPITGVTGMNRETLRAKRNMMILTITRTAVDDVATVPVD